MSRIYTRTGDLGQTSLGDGSRVSKSIFRVSLYGAVDELNSQLGLAVSLLRNDPQLTDYAGVDIPVVLEELQSRLFDLGSILANPEKSSSNISFPTLGMEDLIDTLEKELSPLKSFILPGGHLVSAQLHVARSTSRRVERMAVTLADSEPIPASAIAWLNRLSDFLFVAARAVNAAAGLPDVPWLPDTVPPIAEGSK
jgi:cob(I)alamin adenosyltransferase